MFLNRFGQEVIDRATSCRTIDADIIWVFIGVSPIPFNRGFFQLTLKFYVKLKIEACVGGGRSQIIEGLAVIEKKVVLFGGTGNVSVFRSTNSDSFCEIGCPDKFSNNSPIGVCEVVEPIVLNTRIVGCHCDCACICCCDCCDIPPSVANLFNDNDFVDNDDDNRLLVTLGIFSVIRLERPAQLLINATDYSVPDKECIASDDEDPCALFRSMAFPVNEFNPTAFPCKEGRESGCNRC
ncbi:MAG: hypothetical protein WDA00_00060 [Eubacteriales bacterium]